MDNKWFKSILKKPVTEMKEVLRIYSGCRKQNKLNAEQTTTLKKEIERKIKEIDIEAKRWSKAFNENTVLNLAVMEYKRDHMHENIHDEKGLVRFDIVLKSIIKGIDIINTCHDKGISLSTWSR
jgi:hypothetical protein